MRSTFSFLLLIISCLSSCGYHLQGKATNLSPEIRSVAIPIFANRTLQTGVETEVTQALVGKFISARRLPVASQDSADALLLGTVKAFILSPIAVDPANQTATQYRATLTVEYTLKGKKDGKVLWQGELSEWRNYTVTSDLTVTDNNQQLALQQISVLLAERVHEWILENF